VLRYFYISIGLFLVAVGLLTMFVPIPVPLIALTPLAAGCMILSANSRTARRSIQRARHRSAALSRAFESFAKRIPQSWARILHRTRPDALARHGKMAARNSKI
jgi:hypothetical protein